MSPAGILPLCRCCSRVRASSSRAMAAGRPEARIIRTASLAIIAACSASLAAVALRSARSWAARASSVRRTASIARRSASAMRASSFIGADWRSALRSMT